MNTALGGLFSSRLNMNLREQHGYTYGAFSTVIYRRAPGPFIAVAGVRTDVTAPAVRETFNEIERMRKTELSPEELTMAKNAFSLSLAGNFETTARTAQTVGDLYVYDLPLNYYQVLPSKIDAVTALEVQRVANMYLRPEAMVIVAAGDRAKIEPELKKLDLAPISYRDYEGKPLKSTAAEAK
jgi:zinc protease